MVTTCFFWIENIPQDISCDTRDVLVQYIDYVIKTDIPDESDGELCQSVKRPQTQCIVTVNILKKNHHLHLVVLSFLLFYKSFNS